MVCSSNDLFCECFQKWLKSLTTKLARKEKYVLIKYQSVTDQCLRIVNEAF